MRGLFACCTAPSTSDSEPAECEVVKSTLKSDHPRHAPCQKGTVPSKNKYIEELSSTHVQADARQGDGAAPLAAGCTMGYPTNINDFIQQKAAGSEDGLIEVINANPLSPDRLEVPENGFTHETLQGKPYPMQLGAPPPGDNDLRIATLVSMKACSNPADPKIDNILQLACQVLSMKTILVSLLDGQKLFIKNTGPGGIVQSGIALTPPDVCHWSLVPTLHQMVVVEDTHQDARTRLSGIVANPPHIRFYCGTPLVASNGHRLGLMCILDQEPQPFDEGRAAILCNLAELVVRELEAAWAQRYAKSHSMKLIRAMDCYKQAFLFVDVSAPRWKIMHMNDAATGHAGITKDIADATDFWDIFSINKSQEEPWTGFEKDIDSLKPFVVRNAKCEHWGLSKAKTFNMVFRPATTDAVDESAPMIGIPSGFSAPTQVAAKKYWFVALRPVKETTSTFRELPFEGLKLGPQLGRGSYGRVYRGSYNGKKVAVKVIEDAKQVVMRGGVPMEAAVMEGIEHPGIVRLYNHKIVRVSRASFDGFARQSGCKVTSEEVWLLLEFCDKGSVVEAVDKGWFRTSPCFKSPPKLDIILATAHQIATAMGFLHDRNVIHGDLTGGNVLLKSCKDNEHKFEAKVADFGLSRNMGVASRLETRTYGTLTHMAPEVLSSDMLSRAADVYSFGVMLWEMYSGQRAWAGLNTAQVIHAVAIVNHSLQPPQETPPPLAALMRRCMAHEASARPRFAEVVAEIERLQEALRSGKLQGSCPVPNGQTNGSAH